MIPVILITLSVKYVYDKKIINLRKIYVHIAEQSTVNTI